MNEFKLYRVTAPQVFDKINGRPLDVTIISNDVECAVRGACRRAGYTSISHAAVSANMNFFELMSAVQVSEIEDRSNVVPTPFTDQAVDQALLQISCATEKLPGNIATAVMYWLTLERLKRRHGEIEDNIDTSWVPGLIKSFDRYHTITIE